LHVAIEEVKRLRLIAFDRETIAAEIQLGPAGEVILVLRFLRAILEVPVVDGFRVATSLIRTIIGCMLASAV